MKKSEDKKALANIIMLLNGNINAIKFLGGCRKMILDAERKATEGEGLKILVPKQMLQRLPIANAHVQANNTSEK